MGRSSPVASNVGRSCVFVNCTQPTSSSRFAAEYGLSRPLVRHSGYMFSPLQPEFNDISVFVVLVQLKVHAPAITDQFAAEVGAQHSPVEDPERSLVGIPQRPRFLSVTSRGPIQRYFCRHPQATGPQLTTETIESPVCSSNSPFYFATHIVIARNDCTKINKLIKLIHHLVYFPYFPF